MSIVHRTCDSAVVELPLRLDLAGGWSDTPPICHEQGGCVLNVSILLGGNRAVRAEVCRLPERKVVVESADLGLRGEIVRQAEISCRQDPTDWCALVKSALGVTGYRLADGGLSIRISADVPKGSGLGTSSILGAALTKALLTLREGREPGWRQVATSVLALEQRMQTGGGWEDQLGALVPGVKLLTTGRGTVQRFRVRTLDAEATLDFSKFLRERGVLFFTGQKRMARNVLRGVLDFYAKNPEGIAQAIVKALKHDAGVAFDALRKRDYATFTAKLNAYWRHKKALDPGSTNPFVESVIARISPWTEAVTLCGAGGGGFLFAIASSMAARRKMLRVLKTVGNGGESYDFAIG